MTGLAIIAAKSLIKVLLFMAIAVSTLGTGIPSSLASKTPAIVRLSLFLPGESDPVVELECATRAAWVAYLTEYRGSESVQVSYFERSRRAIRAVCIEVFWTYSAHAQWYAP